MTQDNFSSILELYPPKEVALSTTLFIKQEVAFTFERLVHNYMLKSSKEAKAYGTYLCLLNTLQREEMIGNYVEELLEFVDEETIETILQYIRMGEIPYYLFVNKVLFDVKNCSGYNTKASASSLLLIMLLKTMRASLIAYNKLHKALMEEYDSLDERIQQVVDFAYSWYLEYPQQLKNDYMKAMRPQTDKERHAMLVNEVSIFTEVLIDLFSNPLLIGKVERVSLGDLPRYATVWKEDPMAEMAGLMTITLGEGDTATIENGKVSTVGSKMSCFATDLCGWGPNGETPEEWAKAVAEMEKQRQIDAKLEQIEDEENLTQLEMLNEKLDVLQGYIKELEERLTKTLENKSVERYNDITSGVSKDEAVSLSNEKQIYYLKKVAKDGSSRVMWKGKFNSLEEAEKRKEEICNNPDITKNFDFIIEVGK